MRDLSDPTTGRKMNWTLANAGSALNAIPAEAQAAADLRVLQVAQFDILERLIRERIRTRLIPDTTVDVVLERMSPPMELRTQSLEVSDT